MKEDSAGVHRWITYSAPFSFLFLSRPRSISCTTLRYASVSTPKQADKIVAITSSASVEVEPIWASLLAKALEGKDVKSMLTNIGAGGGAPAAAAPGAAAGGAAAAGGDAPAAEEKKEEAKEGESGLWDDDVSNRSRWLTVFYLSLDSHLQSPTTTWDSDCSTKQFRHLPVRPFFPSQHKTFKDPLHELSSFCRPTRGTREQGSIDKLLFCTGSFGLVLAFVPPGVECWIYEYRSRWRSIKGFESSVLMQRKRLG